MLVKKKNPRKQTVTKTRTRKREGGGDRGDEKGRGSFFCSLKNLFKQIVISKGGTGGTDERERDGGDTLFVRGQTFASSFSGVVSRRRQEDENDRGRKRGHFAFRRPCWNDDDDDDDENDECRSLARIKNTANHGLPVKRASRFSLPRFEPARRLSIPHRRNSSRMKFSRKRGCHDSSRRFFLETTSRSSFPFARNITA